MTRTAPQLRALLAPVLAEVAAQAQLTDAFLDKELFQIYLATLWAQFTLDPQAAGLTEAELEPVHDVLSDHVTQVLGSGHDLRSCFAFINSKAGEQALARYQLSASHRDLLLYFCSLILDPEGHKRWSAEQRAKLQEQPRPY